MKLLLKMGLEKELCNHDNHDNNNLLLNRFVSGILPPLFSQCGGSTLLTHDVHFYLFLPKASSAVGLGITLSHFHSYYLIKLVKVAKSCKCKHDD
jgi:hypothetical protein